ncbi:MAG: type IX secretion system sortase PorU [Candidatus Zixiibacteriota bacterium]
MELYITDFLRRIVPLRAGAGFFPAIAALIFLCLSTAISFAATKSEVRTISSTSSGFHFELPIESEKLSWFVDGDSLVNGYVSVVIGLPYGASPQVSLVSTGQAIPFRSQRVAAGDLSRVVHQVVEISDPRTFRGRQLVTVRIFPLSQGNYFDRVEVRVDFTGGSVAGVAPSDDPVFDKMFRAVVVNYDEFRTWPTAPLPVAKPSAALAGPFGQDGQWLKIAVNQTGLYKITAAQLQAAGVSLTNLASSDIHLYTGGGLPLPVENEIDRPVLTEIRVDMYDGGDGEFGSSDFFLFFGEGQDRWVYSAGDAAEFVHNPYTDRNIYWLHLTSSSIGKRMAAQTAALSGEAIDTHRRYVHVEQSNYLRRYDDGHINDYYNWYWSNLEDVSLYVSTPDIVSGDTAEVRVAALTASPYVDLTVNGTPAALDYASSVECRFSTMAFYSGSNQLNLHLYPPSNAPSYLDYVEVSYTSANAPAADRLDLTLGVYDGSYQVEVLNEFSDWPEILDVTDPYNPQRVAATASGGMLRFGLEGNGVDFRRFYLTPIGAALAPLSIEAADPADLYVTDRQVDLFVVAPRVFAGALEDYVQYREEDGYSISLASVEDIMDNFAYGLYDPIAIRDFLKFAYENYPSPAPSAVLFVGDGNYDFMDYLSTGVPNFVPPCLHRLDQSASDDNYVYFGAYGILDSDTSYALDGIGFDMITARWPVKSISELSSVVDKIRSYESSSHFGIWRNNITLVADDEYSGGGVTTETIHTIQAEELADYHIPRQFNCDKVYLWDYPFVGNRKPEVNAAIVKAINDGTLIVNYIGHGNPDVWSHEAVFTRTDDLPRLSNPENLPLVFAASCAIGFFDDPEREGMAEDFLALAGRGAIGVISATRLVYSSANADFNQTVYDVLLNNDSLSICEAMYAAKLIRQYSSAVPTPVTNDRKYLFFGGPFVKLAVPRLEVEFAEVPDSLTALGLTRITGRVVDIDDSTYARDGVLSVNVYDSEREMVHRIVNSSGVVTQTVEYSVTGPTIYRGSATIAQGEFEFSFLPPLDIGYGGEGAKISVYARFDGIDAAGIADSIAVSDTIASLVDSAGPVIEVAFVGRSNFASGDYIRADDRMQVTITDSSGINLTGALGHGITLEVDYRSENVVNLTSMFEANQDDYTTGSLIYQLDELSSGDHHFKIKAWDNANNSSNYEFDAEVYAVEELAIRDLLNYPNPMRESTRFSFYLTEAVERFSLEIFTLSGRRIKSFERYSLTPGYYDDIEWYGQDNDGSRVATEVYIYKATAHPANGGEKVETFGKLVVVN